MSEEWICILWAGFYWYFIWLRLSTFRLNTEEGEGVVIITTKWTTNMCMTLSECIFIYLDGATQYFKSRIYLKLKIKIKIL